MSKDFDKFIQDLREERTAESQMVKLIVTEFSSTVGNLAVKIEKLADRQDDHSKQMVELLSQANLDRQKTELLLTNTYKTLEQMAVKVDDVDIRVKNVEREQTLMEGQKIIIERRSVWWSSNWFKVIGLIVPSAVVINLIWELVKEKI